MDHPKSLLCAAANVEVPAYLVLRQKAYSVTASGNDSWHAKKDTMVFQAQSLIELLGLVSMYEVRGANWAATDLEIDDFLMKYDS